MAYSNASLVKFLKLQLNMPPLNVIAKLFVMTWIEREWNKTNCDFPFERVWNANGTRPTITLEFERKWDVNQTRHFVKCPVERKGNGNGIDGSRTFFYCVSQWTSRIEDFLLGRRTTKITFSPKFSKCFAWLLISLILSTNLSTINLLILFLGVTGFIVLAF